MPLEILEMEQGSEAWHAARCGVPTASNFSAVLASGRDGAPSKTRSVYLRKLAGERVTQQPAEFFQNAEMERGKAMEDEARTLYEFAKSTTVRRVGLGLNWGAGASPDGLIAEDGGLEIKTAFPHILIEILRSGKVPGEHIPQIQGSLWIFERAWWDVMVYWPGLPPFEARVHRDERWISETLAPGVRRFLDELEELVEWLQRGDFAAPKSAEPEIDLATAPPVF